MAVSSGDNVLGGLLVGSGLIGSGLIGSRLIGSRLVSGLLAGHDLLVLLDVLLDDRLLGGGAKDVLDGVLNRAKAHNLPAESLVAVAPVMGSGAAVPEPSVASPLSVKVYLPAMLSSVGTFLAGGVGVELLGARDV